METKHFETVSKQSIGKQTLQWKPNILKPLENKALGTKHCSGNQTFYCRISQNTCLKKVCISPVSDASASARGARARCAEAPSVALLLVSSHRVRKQRPCQSNSRCCFRQILELYRCSRQGGGVYSLSYKGSSQGIASRGGGYPPPPQHSGPDSTPKGIPIPRRQPQPHFQPPVTAPQLLYVPCDRYATALEFP